MVLSGQTIRKRGVFVPFCERTKAFGMTYGLGPAGYDVRIAENLVIPAGGSALASTVEWFGMPNDLLGRVADKSTWARRFLTVQNTIIEPGWCGYLTLELTNHNTPAPWWCFWRRNEGSIEIKAGMPIAQITLEQLDESTECLYRGKYQRQGPGAQPAILESCFCE